MSIVINQGMLDKLVHPIKEIRIRTLHDIDNKLKRGELERVDIQFNAPALFKNLIRWFGQDPVCEELIVLEMMEQLLSGEHTTEIVQFFTPDRIIKELSKIRVLIASYPVYSDLLESMMRKVSVLKPPHEQNAPRSVVLSDVESSVASTSVPDSVRRRNAILDEVEARWKGDSSLYTGCWELPSEPVATVLEGFNDFLLVDEDETNLSLALTYVIPYTKDYPAEFFLQPPYICFSLFHLIRIRKVSVRRGFEMLLHLVESLQKRVRQRHITATHVIVSSKVAAEKTQLSTAAFAYELLRFGTDQLKEISTELDQMSSNMILIVLDQITNFCFDEAYSLEETFPVTRFVKLRNELGYLLKHCRQEWESNPKNVAVRTRHRIVLQIMVYCVDSWKQRTVEKDYDPAAGIDTANNNGEPGSYNPADYATMNSTGHLRALEPEPDDTWIYEMHLALLDYPLKYACPELYNTMWMLIYKEGDREILTDIPYQLAPGVELLRGGPGALNVTANELVATGPDAVKTLFLHRSFGLMRMIMNAVGKCASLATEDGPLWNTIDSITLHLLANRDEEIRCEAYRVCTDMMKEFIGQLDEGAILTRRNISSKVSPKLRALGMPLSLRIVTEITCFGYTSSNRQIRQCAERMLLFLCNTKVFLREKWPDVEEILLPIAPLLQTAAVGTEDTNLRKAVLGLFHPDFGLPWLDMFQGNLRLLFHGDSAIREEGITRVLYLINSIKHPEGELSPCIEQISDTIPNKLCLLKCLYDPRRQSPVTVFDVSAVYALLDVFKLKDVDPALRRSTLTQLNLMAEDPELCEVIHNASGWLFVLEALRNALQIDNCLDYPDAAIPAVGILTKLCFRIVTFRRFFGANKNAYHWIVRALLTFHHEATFRMECCALLYLLLFADCSVGAGTVITLPAICCASAFTIPFVCQHHWETSPFRVPDVLEVLTREMGSGRVGEETPVLDWYGAIGVQIDKRTLVLQVRTGPEEADLWHVCSRAQATTYREHLMRYIRFAFADLWFNGVDKVLKAIDPKRVNTSMNHDLAPIEYRGRVAGTAAFRFNPALLLTKQDLPWLKVMDSPSTFRKASRRIASARGHADVYSGLATLEANMFFPVERGSPVPNQQVIIDTLMSYLNAMPATTADQELLVEVLSTVGNLIDLNQDEIRAKVIEMLSHDASLFVQLLRSETCTADLYAKTVTLLRVTLRAAFGGRANICPPDGGNKTVRPADLWHIRLFHMVSAQLDIEIMDARKIGRVLLLASLLESLADHVNRQTVGIGKVIGRLFHYIKVLRSTSYTGSTIVRTCLITIGKLLDSVSAAITVTPSIYRRLTGQCGNSCQLIRACAWNLLARLASSPPKAEAIVRECAFLPGGIHASCICTLLDGRESCLVRQSAAMLLVTLFYRSVDKNGHVHASVLPLDRAAEEAAASTATGAGKTEPSDPMASVMILLAKQRFFEDSASSLETYTPEEYATDGKWAMPSTRGFVSPEVAQAYALIYDQLLTLQPEAFGWLIFEKGGLRGLLACVCKHQLVHLSAPEWLMVAAVCNLVVQCFKKPNKNAAISILEANPAFFERIVSLLQPTSDVDHAYNQSAMLHAMTSAYVMLCAKELSVKCRAFINTALCRVKLKPLAQLTMEGFRSPHAGMKLASDFHFGSINFMIATINYCTKSSDFTFVRKLEALDLAADDDPDDPVKQPPATWDSDDSEVDEGKEEDRENTNPNRLPAMKAVGVPLAKKQPTTEPTERVDRIGLCAIFQFLLDRFKQGYSLEYSDDWFAQVTQYFAMQAMLRASPQCRKLAWKADLLTTIVERFRAIHETVLGGHSYAEFVRKSSEEKKKHVVFELSQLFRIVSSWLGAPDDVVLLKQAQFNAFCQVVLLFTPWYTGNNAVGWIMLETLAVLAEGSLVVCISFASTITGFPHGIMKLLITLVSVETARIKGARCELRTLDLGLRVLAYCCRCQEGRNVIGKLRLLDNISKLHPSVTKLQPPWIKVTRLWLSFWEHVTRHTDSSEVRHLTVLGALVRKSEELRELALAIIRNMTFTPANQAALLASSDYMFMLQYALQRTSTHSEQLTGAVIVWKIVANNAKGRAAVKASPLVRLIAALVNHHSVTDRIQDQELWVVLMTVYNILQA